MLRLLMFVLPLGVDSFAVAAALGAAGPRSGWARLRISMVFVVFEAGMPLIGLAVGARLATVIGAAADYLAGAAVIGVGAWMLLHGGDDDEEGARRLTTAHGIALIGVGIGISLDELAVGFGLGLTHLPLVPVIVAIAVQALLAAQLGLYLGARIGERFREGAERLAGIALIALGVFLIVQRIVS